MRLTIISLAAATIAYAGVAQGEVRTIPEQLAQDLTRDTSLQDFQVWAIVANLARETGNFQFLQELNPLVKGSRGGLGYAQWTAGRRDAFEEWSADRGLEVTSYEANYGFLMEELNGDYARVMNRLARTRTEEEAVRVVMRHYLAPHPAYAHFNDRLAYAQSYAEGDFSGAGCQSHHDVNSSAGMIRIALCPELETNYTWTLGTAVDELVSNGEINLDIFTDFERVAAEYSLGAVFDGTLEVADLSFPDVESVLDVADDLGVPLLERTVHGAHLMRTHERLASLQFAEPERDEIHGPS